ncbi:uncharacterized protein [Littorina saxatilis]|uniref:uncharacterized protein n=1 Tax=Littorina saxatilis TaxID=31220 RepID=UPI0038B65370
MTGTIVKKSELINSNNRGHFFIALALLDGSDIKIIHLFNAHLHETFSLHRTVALKNLIQRQEHFLFTKASKSSFIKLFKPTEQQTKLAETLVFPDQKSTNQSTKRTISEALLKDVQSRSTITAKVVKVSPVKRVKEGGSLAVRALGIADNEGISKLVLFQQNAEKIFEEGDVINCSNLYCKTYRNRKQLTSLASTEIEFVQDDNLLLLDITSSPPQFLEDPDFNTLPPPPLHTVDEVLFTDVYIICTNASCHRKKYQRGTCPNCAGTSSTESSARASLKLSDGKQVTVFEDNLKVLLGEQPIITTNDELLQQIIEALPITFEADIRTNTLSRVVKK